MDISFNQLIAVVYHILTFGLVFLGFAMLVFKPLSYMLRRTKHFLEIESEDSWLKKPREKGYIQNHLELLLKSTYNKYNDNTLLQFYLITFFIFLVIFFATLKLTDNHTTSLLYGVGAGFLPYFILQVKLSRQRSTASYDLLPAANLLLKKYRSNKHDTYYALREVVTELDGPIQDAFYTIVNAVQTRRNINTSIRLFHHKINTFWSLQLAVIIFQGINESKDIDNALERFVSNMTEQSEAMDKEKTENWDIVHLGYFPIFAIPLTILINQYISGGRAFYFYFEHPKGISVLLFTIIICVFSFLLSLFLTKPKHDI